MRGTLENVAGRTPLDDLAVLHYADPVGDPPHDAEIVRDEQHRHAEVALELRQKLEDLRLDRDVERRRRLVRDQEVGPVRQRHRDHDALPLPARELMGIGGQPALRVLDSHLVQKFENPLARRSAGKPLVQQKRLRQLLFERVQRIERRHRLLKDEADAVAADFTKLRIARADHLVAVEDDGA